MPEVQSIAMFVVCILGVLSVALFAVIITGFARRELLSTIVYLLCIVVSLAVIGLSMFTSIFSTETEAVDQSYEDIENAVSEDYRSLFPAEENTTGDISVSAEVEKTAEDIFDADSYYIGKLESIEGDICAFSSLIEDSNLSDKLELHISGDVISTNLSKGSLYAFRYTSDGVCVEAKRVERDTDEKLISTAEFDTSADGCLLYVAAEEDPETGDYHVTGFLLDTTETGFAPCDVKQKIIPQNEVNAN